MTFINDYDSVSAYVDGEGHLAVAYHYANTDDIRLWVDDGFQSGVSGDGNVNGGEIRTIESTGSTGFVCLLVVTVEEIQLLSFLVQLVIMCHFTPLRVIEQRSRHRGDLRLLLAAILPQIHQTILTLVL